MTAKRFVVSAPSDFARDWLESRFLSLVAKSVAKVVGKPLEIKFVTASQDSSISNQPHLEAISYLPKQQNNYLQLNSRYNFDTFVIGGSNRFAHAAALAVAEKPSEAYNPLFIYGGVGLGKTHLLQAIGQYALRHHRHLKVKYVSSEKFTNDFINSIRDKDKITGFQRRYRNNDILLIDDIQFLENKEATQEEFFHTFNTLYEAGKQVVISSDRPPKDIATLEDRLRTRFESGLIVDIQPPDLETRIAILRKKVSLQGTSTPDEILELIASRIQSNIRELEGALTRILAYSSLTNSPLTTSLVEDVLRDIFPTQPSRPVTINLIQSEVSKYYNITKNLLLGQKRSQNIVLARQIAMYLSRELTDLSLPKIGHQFGKRDHSTVIHAISKIEKLISGNREIYNQVQEITHRIRNKC
jgi:chromosomal replication initiator protein